MGEEQPAGGAPALPPLRDVIRRHDLGARRSLGQHFLLDGNLIGRIVRAAGDLAGRSVIEVGPGPGGLTRGLLATGARRVYAIEKDARCIEALRELGAAFPGRLEIIEGDARDMDATSLGAAPRAIVANLPYNVASALLVGWLRDIGKIERAVLMFQKEVALRIAAAPGSRAFGRLSVITQWLCQARVEFDIDRRAFTPPPKVTSSVLTLIPRERPLAPARFDDLEALTARAFSQRRKMLRTSLAPLRLDLEALGIDPTARAETLSVEQFCALARASAEKTPKDRKT